MKTEERASKNGALLSIKYGISQKMVEALYVAVATEQKEIDIEQIPQIYVRWLMIDGEKPSWKEYANKAMED